MLCAALLATLASATPARAAEDGQGDAAVPRSPVRIYTLPPLRTPPAPSKPPPAQVSKPKPHSAEAIGSTGGWTAIGAAVALGLAAGGIYISAAGDRDAFNQKVAPGFRQQPITAINYEDARIESSRISERLTRSAVLGGVAAVLGTVGLWLVVGDDEASVTATPVGATLSARF